MLLCATVCAERDGDTTVLTDEVSECVGDGGLLGRVFGGTGDGDLDRGAVLIKCSGDSSLAAAVLSALGSN